jgi:hypothetical protein
MASVYQINKGINRSIEFKGLKAQYIWYLGGGILCLLIIYVALYILGISRYICMAVILTTGSGLVYKVYGMSNKYGEHGMMKEMAKRSIPNVVKANSRSIFLKKDGAGQKKEV